MNMIISDIDRKLCRGILHWDVSVIKALRAKCCTICQKTRSFGLSGWIE